MSSTNKTPLLELNQWAATDPVLREDFNSDNAIIDAVLGAAAYERIMTFTTAEAAQVVSLDVSGIDWDKYIRVDIIVDNATVTPDSYNTTNFTKMSCRLNSTGVAMKKRDFDGTVATDAQVISSVAAAWNRSSTLADTEPCFVSGRIAILPQVNSGGFGVFVEYNDIHVHSNNVSHDFERVIYSVAPGVLTLAELQSLDFTQQSIYGVPFDAGARIYVYGVKR